MLMPSCLSSDLDMIKLMETQYPLNSWSGACTPELTQWCDKEMGPVKPGGRFQQRLHSVSLSGLGHC